MAMEARADAAIELSEHLFRKWSAAPDDDTRLMAASLFIAAAVATIPNRADAEKLVEIAQRTAANLMASVN